MKCLFAILSKVDIKRKRGLVTSSTFLRYRQTPILLKRVKVHAERREPSTSVLAISFEILPIFQEQESKVDVLSICPISIYLSP